MPSPETNIKTVPALVIPLEIPVETNAVFSLNFIAPQMCG